MNIVFILGSGHCGSTLLDLILDCHSKIIGVGEFENVGKEKLCSCGRDFEECELWKNILKHRDLSKLKIFRTKKDFLLNKNNFYYYKKEMRSVDLNSYITENENMFDQVLGFFDQKKDFIVDSSKNVDRFELLFKSNYIRPIILHVVRDGRAVTWSYFKKYKKAMPYMWKWFAQNFKIYYLKKRNKADYVFVRYENLAKNPKKEIERILNSLGLVYEENMLNFRNFTHHQAGGNRMRLSGTNEIKEDVSWKKNLPMKYRLLFNILFGWLNFYYARKR
ncbi:MAG: hypothetical protein GF349_02005 [Candidatus Magasanikbacteria bacterium]|nr:hypothetical protein [Candidatus Magasanikbacteria bacterium]